MTEEPHSETPDPELIAGTVEAQILVTEVGGSAIAFSVVDPLGNQLTCDEDTLNEKVTKHGKRFVTATTGAEVFSKPVLIARSQNDWQPDSLMYFRPYDGAGTSEVKWIRGTAKLDSGCGDVTSIHPRGEIGHTGEVLYMNMGTSINDGS